MALTVQLYGCNRKVDIRYAVCYNIYMMNDSLTQEEKELIAVVLANSVHDPESEAIHPDCILLYWKVSRLWHTPELPEMPCVN